MSGKSALILGATGATGGHVLRELLASPHFTRVGEYGRRNVSASDLESVDAASRAKLEQKTIDFEKLDEAGLKSGKWDVVYITLGTTKAAAGSAEAFVKIDREYVLNAARAAYTADPSHPQRLVYLSSNGSSASSPFLYPQSKGLTERGLASIGYSDFIALRPGFLAGAARDHPRPMETAFGYLTGFLSHISSSVEINVKDLARSILIAGREGTANLPPVAKATPGPAFEGTGPYTVIDNAGLLALSREA